MDVLVGVVGSRGERLSEHVSHFRRSLEEELHRRRQEFEPHLLALLLVKLVEQGFEHVRRLGHGLTELAVDVHQRRLRLGLHDGLKLDPAHRNHALVDPPGMLPDEILHLDQGLGGDVLLVVLDELKEPIHDTRDVLIAVQRDPPNGSHALPRDDRVDVGDVFAEFGHDVVRVDVVRDRREHLDLQLLHRGRVGTPAEERLVVHGEQGRRSRRQKVKVRPDSVRRLRRARVGEGKQRRLEPLEDLLVHVREVQGGVQEHLHGAEHHGAVGALQPVLQRVHDVESLGLVRGFVQRDSLQYRHLRPLGEILDSVYQAVHVLLRRQRAFPVDLAEDD